MQVVELVEKIYLEILKVVALLLIRSNGVRVCEVRNPATPIKVILLRPFNPDQLLRLLKQLVSSVGLRCLQLLLQRVIFYC